MDPKVEENLGQNSKKSRIGGISILCSRRMAASTQRSQTLPVIPMPVRIGQELDPSRPRFQVTAFVRRECNFYLQRLSKSQP